MAGSHQGLPDIFVQVWRITLKSCTGVLGRILRTGDQCCKRTMYLLQTMSDFYFIFLLQILLALPFNIELIP